MILNSVKAILGISDSLQDGVLNTIIDLVTKQLRQKLHGVPDGIPEELEYILIEVTVARFNRLGSEFVSSQTEEGHSLSWANQDYFSPFLNDIEVWNERQDPYDRSGAVILI